MIGACLTHSPIPPLPLFSITPSFFLTSVIRTFIGFPLGSVCFKHMLTYERMTPFFFCFFSFSVPAVYLIAWCSLSLIFHVVFRFLNSNTADYTSTRAFVSHTHTQNEETHKTKSDHPSLPHFGEVHREDQQKRGSAFFTLVSLLLKEEENTHFCSVSSGSYNNKNKSKQSKSTSSPPPPHLSLSIYSLEAFLFKPSSLVLLNPKELVLLLHRHHHSPPPPRPTPPPVSLYQSQCRLRFSLHVRSRSTA